MARQRGSGASDDAVPASPAAVPAPTLPPTYEPSHVIQLLVTLQKDIGVLTANTDRLIKDVAAIDLKVTSLHTKVTRAEGVGIATVVLFAAFSAFFWWLFSNQLNMVRDKIFSLTPPAVTATQPAAAMPPMKPPQP